MLTLGVENRNEHTERSSSGSTHRATKSKRGILDFGQIACTSRELLGIALRGESPCHHCDTLACREPASALLYLSHDRIRCHFVLCIKRQQNKAIIRAEFV